MSDHPELQGLDDLGIPELRDLYMNVGELIDEARRSRAYADLAYWLASREVLEVCLDQRLSRELPF